MIETTVPAERPAPLWRRLLALVYELLVVLAIVLVTVMLFTLAKMDPRAWWYRVLLLLVVEAYFVASWVRGGQSLGMRAWRLYLRSADGGTPDLARALLRFVIVVAPMMLLALGLVAGIGVALAAPIAAWTLDLTVAAFDPRRRALHDILAGTWIAYRPAPDRRL